MRAPVLFLLLASGITQGCSSIYLYETEKYSLTVEGRPDASSPASFNFGAKQRVAIVTPRKTASDSSVVCEKVRSETPETPKVAGETDTKNGKVLFGNGEAMSILSYFNLDKKPKEGLFNDPITVETAVMTGKVAACLGSDKQQGAKVMNAMIPERTGYDAGVDYSVMANIISLLSKSSSTEAKNHLNSLNTLGKSVLPKTLPISTYSSKVVGVKRVLNPEFTVGSNNPLLTDTSGIDEALKYLGKIDESKQVLKGALSNPASYEVDNLTLDNPNINMGINELLKKTEYEILRVRRALAENSAYTDAIQFYIDQYLKNK